MEPELVWEESVRRTEELFRLPPAFSGESYEAFGTWAEDPRQQLFFYRDLWVWLDDPFQAPPALTGIHDDPQQLAISW